jgi:hypothetical protein
MDLLALIPETKQIRCETTHQKLNNKAKIENINWNYSGAKQQSRRQRQFHNSIDKIRDHEIATGNGVMSSKHSGFLFEKDDDLREHNGKVIPMMVRGF